MTHGLTLSGPWMQLGGSLIAVFALAAYVHWLWDRRAREPLDRDAVLTLFRAEHPDIEACDALLTADGRAAVIRLADRDRVGVVAAFGARWRTRVIAARDIAALDETAGDVRVRLREIAQPVLFFRFADGAEAEPWWAPLRQAAR